MSRKKFKMPDTTQDENNETSEVILIEDEGEPEIQLPNPIDKRIGKLRQELRDRLKETFPQNELKPRLRNHRRKLSLKINHRNHKGK